MDEKAIERLLVELDDVIDAVFSLRTSRVRKSDMQDIGNRLDGILMGMRNAIAKNGESRRGSHEQRP